MNRKEYFLLYENCIPVLGKESSLIMDIQRNEYFEITNLMCKILIENLKRPTIYNLRKSYDFMYNDGIDAFFSYLFKNDLGFYTREPSNFIKINKEFKSPFSLLTSVISFNKKSNYSIKKVFSQLVDLGCQSIQLRLFGIFDLALLKNILDLSKESRVAIIEVYIESKDYELEFLKSIMYNNLRVHLYIHSHKENKRINVFKDNKEYQITFIKKRINEFEKEKFSIDLLTCNTKFYIEALNFNVGLNRKISIDSKGNIKNYISHNESFGHVSNVKIKNVLKLNSFQKKWYISNDKIEKCKECRYRYMCLSNSDIELIDGKYYKLDYCNLDI